MKPLLSKSQGYNELTHIGELSDTLHELHLNNNQIKTLQSLEKLQKLRILNVLDNPLNTEVLSTSPGEDNNGPSITPVKPSIEEELASTLPFLVTLPFLHILDMPYPQHTLQFILHILPNLDHLCNTITVEDKVNAGNVYAPSASLSSSLERSERLRTELSKWRYGVEHWTSPNTRPPGMSYAEGVQSTDQFRPIMLQGDADVTREYADLLLRKWPHRFAEPILHTTRTSAMAREGIDSLTKGETGGILLVDGPDSISVDGMERVRRIGKRCIVQSQKVHTLLQMKLIAEIWCQDLNWNVYNVTPHRIAFRQPKEVASDSMDKAEVVIESSFSHGGAQALEEWTSSLLST